MHRRSRSVKGLTVKPFPDGELFVPRSSAGAEESYRRNRRIKSLLVCDRIPSPPPLLSSPFPNPILPPAAPPPFPLLSSSNSRAATWHSGKGGDHTCLSAIPREASRCGVDFLFSTDTPPPSSGRPPRTLRPPLRRGSEPPTPSAMADPAMATRSSRFPHPIHRR